MRIFAIVLISFAIISCAKNQTSQFKSVEPLPEQTFEPLHQLPEHIKKINSFIPIFSQRIQFTHSSNLLPVFENNEGGRYILEYVPKGQSVTNWSEMVTFIGFENVPMTVKPRDVVMGTANDIRNSCPDSFIFEPIGETKVGGYNAFEAIVGCANSPNDIEHIGVKKGQGEVAYFLAIKGINDIYFIQKAKRTEGFPKTNSPITRSNYKNYVADILAISICNHKDDPFECSK